MGTGLPRARVERERRRASAGVPLPEPGFLETIAAGFTSARADNTNANFDLQEDAYRRLLMELAQRGHASADYVTDTGANGPYSLIMNRALIYRAAQAEGIAPAASMEEFEGQILARYRKQLAPAEDVANRGNGFASFVGGVTGAMTDPINIVTLPLGSAALSPWRRIGTEMLINGALEAAVQPMVAAQREQAGRTALTLEEALMNTAFAAGGAAALGGLGELAAAGGRRIAATDFMQNRLMVREVDGMRINPVSAAREALEANDPGLNGLTQRQIDSLLMAEREVDIAGSNPFRPNGGGIAAYDALLTDAWARALTADPFPQAPRAPALTTSAPVRVSADGGAPAFSPREVDGGAGAQAAFMARVRQVESGGVDNARNRRSSATGRYQFTDGTWLAYYKRRYGTGGLTNAQILARRSEGRIQDELMGDLTRENAGALRGGGQAVTPGNLYLAHFAGPRGALDVLRAEPQADLGAVLGQEVINANPFLRGKSAGWLVRWASQKMGSPVPRQGNARIEFGDSIGDMLARNEEEAAAIQDALDAAIARADELAEAARGGNTRAELDEAEAAGWEPDFTDFDGRLPEMNEAPADAPPPETAWLMDGLRAIVATRGRSLNQVDKLADELGATPAEVRTALGRLVGLGELVQRKDGAISRRAPARDTGNQSLIEWIAARGGITDPGGDLRSMGLGNWHRNAPFRRRVLLGDDRSIGARKRNYDFMTPERAARAYTPKQESAKADEGDYENNPENTFIAAIEAGFFPELDGFSRQDAQIGYEDLPGINLLFEAINRELAGKPRFRPGEGAGQGGEFADVRADDVDIDDEEARLMGDFLEDLDAIDPAIRSDPAFEPLLANAMLVRLDMGVDPIEALQIEAMARYDDLTRRAQAELVGDIEDRIDGWQPFTEEEFADWLARYSAGDDESFLDGGSPGPDARDAGGSSGAGQRNAEADGQALARLPEAERAPFLDPDGEAAKAQADSLEHDARAEFLAIKERLEAVLPFAESGVELWIGRPGEKPRRLAKGPENPGLVRTVFELADIGNDPAKWDAFMAEAPKILEGRRWMRFGDVEVRVGAPEALAAAVDLPFAEGDAFVAARTPGHPNYTGLTPADAAFYEGGRLPEGAEQSARPAPEQADFAAPTPEQARIALERQAEGRLKGTVPQKEPGSDGGLFDANEGRGDTTADMFRIDEEGPPQSMDELLRAIEQEQADLKNIRDCL